MKYYIIAKLYYSSLLSNHVETGALTATSTPNDETNLVSVVFLG